MLEQKTKSKLALLYNDQAILDNHHASTSFFLIEGDEKCNIFETLGKEEQGKMRKFIIENILYTDMSKRFAFTAEIKSMVGKEDFSPSDAKYKPGIMKALIHAADIGNPSRHFEIRKGMGFKDTFRIL